MSKRRKFGPGQEKLPKSSDQSNSTSSESSKTFGLYLDGESGYPYNPGGPYQGREKAAKEYGRNLRTLKPDQASEPKQPPSLESSKSADESSSADE